MAPSGYVFALLLLVVAGARAMSTGATGPQLSRLVADSKLPRGFSVGTTGFGFRPEEKPDMNAKMNLTLIALEQPTESFAAVFTRNAFPGAPVIVGKRRLQGSQLQAVLVNNKISNVCAGGEAGGVADSERLCEAVAASLGLGGGGELVVPSSTGVIGWRLPVDAMCAQIDALVAARQSESGLPAAQAIMTTDAYPKLRAEAACGGRIVAFAKGAGMIEPDMATMLAFILTDVAVPKEELQAMLVRAVEKSFNCISVDGDQSTSDTVLALSSAAVALPPGGAAEFEAALCRVCERLAADVVRNGEGVHHVMDVRVRGAPSAATARAVGKAVVNSNLLKCAIAGNDPNVGRIVAAIGSCVGKLPAPLDVRDATITMGGRLLFERGQFALDGAAEDAMYAYLCDTQLPPEAERELEGGWPFPPHERCVEIEVDLGAGDAAVRVLGSDLTHEYVTINCDYRS